MVLPELDFDELDRRTKLCATASLARGFGDPKVYRAHRAPIVGAPERRVELLDPLDASELYDQLHRLRVLVCAFASCLIRTNPARNPAAKREAIGLESFVFQKAVYQLVRADADVAAAFSTFEAWRRQTHCNGEDDPRVLPFHVFESASDRRSLGTEAGDAAFEHRHGRPSHRRDDRRNEWSRAQRTAYHGRDVLGVAGFALEPGMHWDVTGKTKIQTSHQIWKLEGRHPYLNIYPNARVRHAQISTARLSWSSPENATGK